MTVQWAVMETPVVSAEVTAAAGREREAALRLQQAGFRVRHVGSTSISVEAPAPLWEKTFGITLVERRAPAGKGLPGQRHYHEPTGPLAIPAALSELITDVAFVRPPELF
jgi:hypothetical protein